MRDIEEIIRMDNWKYWIHYMRGENMKFCEKFGYVDDNFDCEGCSLCIYGSEK